MSATATPEAAPDTVQAATSVAVTDPHLRERPRAVSRSGLPGRALAQAQLPAAERAAFIAVVPLLSAPAVLATGGASWMLATASAVTAVVTWLCLARHTVVGHGWVADRRLWHYRITHASHLRAVELVGNGHGGLLKLHPHDGRPHRLRESEFAPPASRTALSALTAASDATVCQHARRLLDLPALSGSFLPAASTAARARCVAAVAVAGVELPPALTAA